jgi:purine-nucleoside phosphorylase
MMFAEYDPERIIKKVFGVQPDQIASTVIIAPVKRIVAELEEQILQPQPFGTWFTGVSGYLDKNRFITVLNNIRYAPGMADCVYFLQFAGVKNILYTGSIGGLAEGMEIGDFVLAKDCERGDGASGYFASLFDRACVCTELAEHVQPILQTVADEEGHQLFVGDIFTTDSLAAETIPFLTALSEKGFMGIEMETSALYTVARTVGIDAVAAHVVSDLPLEGKTLFDDQTKKEKERRVNAHSAIVRALTNAVKTLNPDSS